MQVTAVSDFIEQMGSVIKSTIIINQLLHNLISLQRASTIVCLLANIYPSAGYYISGSEPDNSQQMDEYGLQLVYIG